VILFIFYLGLTSLDPPPDGIAINFGTTEFGSGNIQPTEPIQSAQPTAAAAASSDDEILSQDIGSSSNKKKKANHKQVATEEVKPKPKENLNHQKHF
jgi:hypothetical protein